MFPLLCHSPVIFPQKGSPIRHNLVSFPKTIPILLRLQRNQWFMIQILSAFRNRCMSLNRRRANPWRHFLTLLTMYQNFFTFFLNFIFKIDWQFENFCHRETDSIFYEKTGRRYVFTYLSIITKFFDPFSILWQVFQGI